MARKYNYKAQILSRANVATLKMLKSLDERIEKERLKKQAHRRAVAFTVFLYTYTMILN